MALGIGSIWLLQSDLCKQEIRGIVCGACSCCETWRPDSHWKKVENRCCGDKKKFPLLPGQIQSSFSGRGSAALALKTQIKKTLSWLCDGQIRTCPAPGICPGGQLFKKTGNTDGTRLILFLLRLNTSVSGDELQLQPHTASSTSVWFLDEEHMMGSWKWRLIFMQ